MRNQGSGQKPRRKEVKQGGKGEVEKQRVILDSYHVIRLLKIVSSNGEQQFSAVHSLFPAFLTFL